MTSASASSHTCPTTSCPAERASVKLQAGCGGAFVVSLAAIRFLMDYVKRHNFKVFGLYRIVLGVIVLAVAAVSAIV